MSELLWIAVPGGITEQGGTRVAHLRIALMPKLERASLAEAGMAQWPPPSLVTGTLVVDFATGPDMDVVPVSVPPPHVRPQAGVWDAFFGAGTTVRTTRPANAPPAVDVAPTAAEAAAVRGTFENCARIDIRDGRSPLVSAVQAELKTNWSTEPSRAVPATASGAAEPPDFHRTVALLREHPAVLRALGFIIELTLPASTIAHADGVVRVRWPDAAAAGLVPTIVSPWTAYGGTFLPGSTDNISNGMVTLTDDRPTPPAVAPRWSVTTVDVDSATARLRSAARSLAVATNGNEQPPETLPALRSGGLTLLRNGRATDFEGRRSAAVTNATRNSMGEAVLTADDLLLGYRIDVLPHGGREWLSLQQRAATYTVGADMDIGAAGAREEGHVKAHAATIDGSGAIRADEIVARWNGWSLAVPQPVFDRGIAERQPERRASVPFDFRWTFKVPKETLPALRFGEQYRLRARAADIAGGGLALADPAAARCATELTGYRRYEPVASPEVALPDGSLAAGLGPGESATVVVIRSERDESVAEFAEGNPRYPVTPRRVFLAPPAPLALAEQHDMLKNVPVERTFEWLKRGTSRGDADGVQLPDAAAGGICVFPRIETRELVAQQTERAWTEPWPDLLPSTWSSERARQATPLQSPGRATDPRMFSSCVWARPSE